MKKNTFSLALILLLIFMSASDVSAEKIWFIVNKSVHDQLTKNVIKKIFLGRKSKWNNQERIIFFTFDSTDIIQQFARTYLGKSKQQFDNYWKRQLFTGKGSIPKSIKTLDESFKIISQTKGSIMFIPSQNHEINHDNIRIISIK
jgi:ABC-type phosphate transport system substrate-binding protein